MTSPPDPYLDLPEGPEWKACIGRQGTEESHVDGSIEAAIEPASAAPSQSVLAVSLAQASNGDILNSTSA